MEEILNQIIMMSLTNAVKELTKHGAQKHINWWWGVMVCISGRGKYRFLRDWRPEKEWCISGNCIYTRRAGEQEESDGR